MLEIIAYVYLAMIAVIVWLIMWKKSEPPMRRIVTIKGSTITYSEDGVFRRARSVRNKWMDPDTGERLSATVEYWLTESYDRYLGLRPLQHSRSRRLW